MANRLGFVQIHDDNLLISNIFPIFWQLIVTSYNLYVSEFRIGYSIFDIPHNITHDALLFII